MAERVKALTAKPDNQFTEGTHPGSYPCLLAHRYSAEMDGKAPDCLETAHTFHTTGNSPVILHQTFQTGPRVTVL